MELHLTPEKYRIKRNRLDCQPLFRKVALASRVKRAAEIEPKNVNNSDLLLSVRL